MPGGNRWSSRHWLHWLRLLWLVMLVWFLAPRSTLSDFLKRLAATKQFRADVGPPACLVVKDRVGKSREVLGWVC
jgi:hypothetical protein